MRVQGAVASGSSGAVLQASGVFKDAAPTTSAGPATTSAPAQPSCSAVTADQALEAALNQGLLDMDPEDTMIDMASTTAFDPCADLSAIAVPLGFTGLSPLDLQLFHQGKPLGSATELPYPFNPDKIARVDDGTLTVSFLYLRPDDASNADASGVATSTFTWDDVSGKVVRSGELPPTDLPPSGEDPAGSMSEQPGAAQSGDVVSVDEAKIVFPGDAMDFEMGYCFAEPERIACHTYDSATSDRQEYVLEADGPVTGPVPYDGPMGFEDPAVMDMIVDLEPGQTLDLGSVTCVASARDLACTSATSGAGVTFTDGAAQVTPPTR